MRNIFIVLVLFLSVLNAGTLKNLTMQVIENNPSIKVKNALLKSSQYEIKKANGAYLPTLNLNFSHTGYAEYKPTNQTEANQASLKLKYNLFNGFKDQQTKEVAVANSTIAELVKEKTENKILFDFVKAYINLQKTYEVYQLSEKNLIKFTDLSKIQDIKFKNHDITLKNYSKSKKDNIVRAMDLLDDQMAYKNALASFQNYFSFFDLTQIHFLEKLNYKHCYIGNDINALQDLKIHSFAINEIKKSVMVEKLKTQKEEINFYPKVDLILNKSINQVATQNNPAPIEETSWSVAFSLNLFNGNQNQNKHKVFLQKYKSKQAKLEDTIITQTKVLKETLNNFNNLLVKYKLQKDILKYMQDEVRSIEYEYRGGTSSMVDILKSLSELHSLEKRYIQSKYSLIILKYEIYYKIGILKDKILQN